VGTAYDDDLSYEFDEFIVWRDAAGAFLWASDSGCSCPAPFEDVTLQDLGKGTAAHAHAALDKWAGSDPAKLSSMAELHLAISQDRTRMMTS
jgi:hypothetical protein